MNLLDNAFDKITIELLKSLDFGDEIELNEEYTLYHYIEDDFISLVRTEDWTELFAIMYDDESGEIIFEEL